MFMSLLNIRWHQSKVFALFIKIQICVLGGRELINNLNSI